MNGSKDQIISRCINFYINIMMTLENTCFEYDSNGVLIMDLTAPDGTEAVFGFWPK
ncbi:hypothetical protein CM15mP37_10810 [bacterium]|nr:MAG: hypothetical protein CM15mP37_10810 [bacterium]